MTKGLVMRKLLLISLAFAFAGCATTGTQREKELTETLKKNPQIVFQVIEDNPEAFLESVNKAAQMAQMKQYEKQVTEIKKQQAEELKNPKQPFLDVSKRLAGNDNGKIVIVEYADFECPACGMAYGPLKELKEKYKNDVQFYFKHMPLDFHPQAMPAAQYFEAVRMQDKAKAQKFYDYVFKNQKNIGDEGFFKKALKAVGADVKKAEKDKDSEAVQKVIEGDMAEFHKFGYTGTPVTLVNGVTMMGAQKLENLESIIRQTKK